MRRILIIALVPLAIALGAVEGVAYWWMCPAPAGLGQPVLVYRQGEGKMKSPGEEAAARISSTVTSLPDVVTAALPSLRCTTGTAARIERDDDVTIHVAFFEWDLSSSTNVLEAFKHLPEECMGSIGMTLVEKAPVRTYMVGGQGTDDRLSVAGSPLSDGESVNPKSSNDASIPSSATDNRQPTTDNSSSSTLTFDHTVFRDPRGVVVHAFKGTWVSGATDLLGEGVRGGVELWNQIRWNAALKRFRPAHARVVQGAVRGIPNPDLAWEAFESAMLKDLSFR